MELKLERERVLKHLSRLKMRQGFRLGKWVIDPVYLVMAITLIVLTLGSENFERFIYWVKIKSNEMTYQRDFSNDPMGVMKESLKAFAALNSAENMIEITLDGVTSYKYLDSRFKVRFLIVDKKLEQCWLIAYGDLIDPEGGIDGDNISVSAYCGKNNREIHISDVSAHSLINLEARQSEPWVLRFGISKSDEGIRKLQNFVAVNEDKQK
jgi:hypothetical protein